jgi:hypothetical protein
MAVNIGEFASKQAPFQERSGIYTKPNCITTKFLC